MRFLNQQGEQVSAEFTTVLPGEVTESANVPVAAAPIESFLDRIEQELRRLPLARRAEIRHELRAHLLASAAALEELGDSTTAAIEGAIARFGEPEQIASCYHSVLRQARWNALRRDWEPVLRPFGIAALILIIFESMSWIGSWQGWLRWAWQLNGFLGWALIAALPIAAGLKVAFGRNRFAEGRAFCVLVAFAGIMWPFVACYFNLNAAFEAHHITDLPQWSLYLAFIGLVFALWIPLGMISVALPRLLMHKPLSPLTQRSAAKYAFQFVARCTAVEVVFSALWMYMGLSATSASSPLGTLFFIGWLALASPIAIGMRVGWETRHLALRSSARGFAATALLLLAGTFLTTGFPPGESLVDFLGSALAWGNPGSNPNLLHHLHNALAWCLLCQIIRLPLGIRAAAFGRRQQNKRAQKQESRESAESRRSDHALA